MNQFPLTCLDIVSSYWLHKLIICCKTLDIANGSWALLSCVLIVKNEPEHLENQINEILGLKQKDRLLDWIWYKIPVPSRFVFSYLILCEGAKIIILKC